MALAAHCLCVVSDVETALGITPASQTARLERLIAAASDQINNYCGRTFHRAAMVEKVASHGGLRLLLSRTPVEASGLSVEFDGSEVSDDDYVLEDAVAGILFFPAGTEDTAAVLTMAAPARVRGSEQKLYEVTYNGGYVVQGASVSAGQTRIPYDLEEAAIQATCNAYRLQGVDQNLVGKSVGNASVQYGGVTGAGRMVLTESVKALLAAYRRAV